jgi:DNA-directed RNA polymerase specialized sigma24 family protein
MTYPVMTDQQPVHELRAAAATLLAARGWGLLTADELAGRVTPRGVGEATDPNTAVLHAYSELLYHACAGAEGEERQGLGFAELFRYLFDVIVAVGRDLSEEERAEVANETVAALFYRLTPGSDAPAALRVRNPGAFLAIAIQQARNGVRRWRASRRWFVETAPDLVEADHESDPAERATDRDLAERVRRCFARSLERYPRARTQLAVVWFRHIDGLDYETIAARLAMTPANVRVLHARGVQRLRDDPQWRSLALELGVAGASPAPSGGSPGKGDGR